MAYIFAELLGSLALSGIIRALILYLYKKYDGKSHWVIANLSTAILRTLFVVPRLLESPYVVLDISVMLVIYFLEQQVWFLYDYIQQRRGNKAAGWGLIFGIIIGGVLWLFVLRLFTFYISSMFMSI